jgi:hypothetical protein
MSRGNTTPQLTSLARRADPCAICCLLHVARRLLHVARRLLHLEHVASWTLPVRSLRDEKVVRAHLAARDCRPRALVLEVPGAEAGRSWADVGGSWAGYGMMTTKHSAPVARANSASMCASMRRMNTSSNGGFACSERRATNGHTNAAHIVHTTCRTARSGATHTTRCATCTMQSPNRPCEMVDRRARLVAGCMLHRAATCCAAMQHVTLCCDIFCAVAPCCAAMPRCAAFMRVRLHGRGSPGSCLRAGGSRRMSQAIRTRRPRPSAPSRTARTCAVGAAPADTARACITAMQQRTTCSAQPSGVQHGTQQRTPTGGSAQYACS